MQLSNAFNVACNTQGLIDTNDSINNINCKHTGFHRVLSVCFFNTWLWKFRIKSRPRCPLLCVTNALMHLSNVKLMHLFKCRLAYEERLSLKHRKVRSLLSKWDIIKIWIKVASPDVYSRKMLNSNTEKLCQLLTAILMKN